MPADGVSALGVAGSVRLWTDPGHEHSLCRPWAFIVLCPCPPVSGEVPAL